MIHRSRRWAERTIQRPRSARIEAAAATGRRVSLDLIYAREGQGVADWRAELKRALALPVEHVSLYQLTIEAETAFARRLARGQLAAPDNDLAADFYVATQEICEAEGFPGYEISNHARNAAARSRHNLLYWRSQDWIGIGPGAHGRVTHAGARIASEAHRRPGDYVEAVGRAGIGWCDETQLSHEEASDEALFMGLRIDEGVELARVEGLRGRPLNRCAQLAEQELILVEEGRLRLTARGRPLTDRIVAELVRDE